MPADPEPPAPCLRRSACDTERFLRAGVARRPNVTGALLDRLLSDPVPQVADAAAARPGPTPARMYRILAATGP
ncbi:hypothetical protein [Nocardiopsis protaetiae]|uniref:hypothetical protein n=1 Tax=Nocardiopsis protaetiae TaxID=3382270 RepID=UPI00387AD4D5